MYKAKILVVIPRYSNTIFPEYTYMFPIGFAYVVSAMLRDKLPIEVINLNHMSGTSSGIIKEYLDTGSYCVLCTGGNSLILRELKDIINTAKEHPSKPRTVLGGTIVTSEPELIFKHILPDCGVIGEAENMIGELLTSLLRGKIPSNIPGTIFEHEGRIVKIPPIPISNLNELSFPAMHLLGYDKWLENTPSNMGVNTLAIENPRIYPILATRDCPFKCTFCYHYGKYRERSLDNIFKELDEAVRKYRMRCAEKTGPGAKV